MQLINNVKPLSLSKINIFDGLKKQVDFLRQLFSRNSFYKLLHQILDPRQPNEIKALSAALGVFCGIMPIWGFQILAGVFFAMVFKLNKALVIIFLQVSFPPFIPLIIYLSYKIGGLWITDKARHVLPGGKTPAHLFSINFQQYLLGSITLAIAGAIAAGLIAYACLKLTGMVKQYQMLLQKKQPATI